jgi:two-component system sensor histidine kinase HydH
LKSSRPKTIFLPVLGLLLVTLVLLTMVTITTYFNLQSGRAQAEHVLAAQSSAIVSGMASGLRTGWRFWVWRPDSLQDLINEMSKSSDVAFIGLLDGKGMILAHSDPSLVGKTYERASEFSRLMEIHAGTGWFDRSGYYLAGRLLRDEEYGPPREEHPMGPLGLGRFMGGREARQMEQRLKPSSIIVGLKTKAYREVRQRQLQHSLIMAGLLFVVGCGAIYFIFLAQNYKTIDRTLANLSTYTSEIVENMPNGLITLDASNRPVMVNRAAREMFGWGNHSVVSLAEEPIITALSREFSVKLAQGKTVLEEEFVTPGGNASGGLPLAVSASGVPAWSASESGPGVVFILRDLRQIRALEEQIRQSEKLAAVGRLAAGIAHEVRNPLSSMRGLARFLGRNLDQTSREAEYLKVMVEEIDRLDRVISGLLDFARPRKPEIAPIYLNEVARHTSDLITDDARHQGISVREDMSPLNPVVCADRDQIIQAMLNVLLNALEATPDGGRMTVMTQVENGEAVFAVEDSGPGIPFQDRSKLLDPFYTTKKKGTGLGLAQVASIMESHGGRVELGGEPGVGARVALWLPISASNSEENPCPPNT